MSGTVAIHGNGIAACSCARLLMQRGFRVSCGTGIRSAAPILLINQSTQRLLADVFDPAEKLLRDCPQIRKRVVLWGHAAELTVLPHAGTVVSEAVLLARLWERVEALHPCSDQEPNWSVYSIAKAAPAKYQSFGARVASAVSVQLRDLENDACWIESVDTGWLFLLPCGNGKGSLLAIGDAPMALLEKARLISPQIEGSVGPGAPFPAYPRILDPLCAGGWLACGGGAMSFDPICGEGAGNAVREAILASAVIDAIHNGAPPDAALAHYASRLLAGFLRHLKVARQFYAACRGEWWESQLVELDRGIQWTQRELAALPRPQYWLRGLDLERLPEREVRGPGQ